MKAWKAQENERQWETEKAGDTEVKKHTGIHKG